MQHYKYYVFRFEILQDLNSEINLQCYNLLKKSARQGRTGTLASPGQGRISMDKAISNPID